MTSVLIKPHFFGAYHHRFHSKHKEGTLWSGTEQRRGHQDTVQPIEHRSTSLRKCVQHAVTKGLHGWISRCSLAVGSAFQTAGRWWPSASAGTRSVCRNRHELVFRSSIPSHPKEGYVTILKESLLWEKRLGKTRIRITEGLTTCQWMEPHRRWTIAISS